MYTQSRVCNCVCLCVCSRGSEKKIMFSTDEDLPRQQREGTFRVAHDKRSISSSSAFDVMTVLNPQAGDC